MYVKYTSMSSSANASTEIHHSQQAFLDLIKSSNINNAALIAFKLLPVQQILPNVIINEIFSNLLPQDRIILSHTCHYFRNLIISPQGLSDLWLYIYHIPITPKPRPRNHSPTSRSTSFHPFMLFHQSTSNPNNNNTQSSHPQSLTISNINTTGPSHATSLPNTIATSTTMSSRQLSIKSLFGASSSNSSPANSRSPSKRASVSNANANDDEDIAVRLAALRVNTSANEEEEEKSAPKNNDYTRIATTGSSSAEMNEDNSIEIRNTTNTNTVTILTKDRSANDGNLSDSTMSSTDPLLEHPSVPVLTSKIIYWPNYKQVLACDFPLHWRRKNSFYENLNIMSKNCGGAHVRVFEVGMDRLKQILSRISPMLLALCFLNVRSIHLDSYAKHHMAAKAARGYENYD